jgi:hypothetical protein
VGNGRISGAEMDLERISQNDPGDWLAKNCSGRDATNYQIKLVYTILIKECPANQFLVLVEWRYLAVPQASQKAKHLIYKYLA